MTRAALLALLLVLLAGCAEEASTPTQGYELSAPTLAPSPVVDTLATLRSAEPTPI